MRRLVSILLLLILGLWPRAAQAATAITAPADGSTVGRNFTLSGSAEAGAGLGLTIDGRDYLPPDERDRTAGEPPGPAVDDANGHWIIAVDLNGLRVVTDAGGYHGIADGPHQLEV